MQSGKTHITTLLDPHESPNDNCPAIKRIEQRYIVPEETAVELRGYVCGHLRLDEHGVAKENLSYEVRDLYFDSDGLQLYWSSIQGYENQVRLRLRFYGDDSETIFLETKQRLKNSLLKERVAIRRNATALLSSETDPNPDFLISRTRDHMMALERFGKIIRNLKAKPKVHMAFSREAYRAQGIAVTFDRFVRAEPALSIQLRRNMQHPTLIFGNDIVIELKCVGHQPALFGQITRDFSLRSGIVEKYVDAVALHGENLLRT
jgi:hypothetical protein